jgi:cholest-4-en-3-one 26-monooxygenase
MSAIHHHPDLSDADTFTDGFPHDYFRQLRREAPVYFHERNARGGPGFFVLSRYEDVKAASRDPGLWSSASGITIFDPPETVEMGQHSMLFMDPPQHVRFRKLVSAGFTPRRIGGLQDLIRERARSIVADVARRGRCDFVTDVAAELPLQMIADFIGVPQEKRHVLFECSNKMIGAEDPEYAPVGADMDQIAMEASIGLYALADEIAAERLREPKDDIVSTLLTAEVDGEKLSPTEFNAFFVLLSIAGNETTRNQTAQGLRLLLEHPDALRAVQRDLSLLPAAIEEMVRYNPPVMYFRRTATDDCEIRGVKIRKGQMIIMYYPSANRDDAVFPEPDRFEIRRSPNEHLGFGIGEHFCLGANLARMQLRAIFTEVLTQLHDIQLDGPIDRLRSHFIDGIKHMPIRFEAA